MSALVDAVRKRTWIVDIIAMAALLGIVIAGFSHAFDSPGYLIPAIGGALIGIAIAIVGAGRRWNLLAV